MGLIERLAADVTCLRGALRTLKMTTPIAKNPTRVFPQVILDLAAEYGDAPALLSIREQLTYRELAARANRYARWALAQDLRKGDTVCLLMPGRPEFVAIWVGVTSVGGVVALLNTHLSGPALAHCINVVAPRHIIVAAELFESLEFARTHIAGDVRIWLHGDANANFRRIDREIDDIAGDALADTDRPRLTIEDRALYIYTSGTTGLPKAANVNHYRVMLATHAFAGVMATRASDRMYDCLPLYHTAGGLLATGALLVRGGSVVIRDKFSARRVLGRHRALGLHLLSIHRRALPLSRQYPAASARALASASPGLRQRVAARRLAAIPAALRDPANHRVLCRNRGQRLAVQFRRKARRRREAAVVHRQTVPHQDRAFRR